MDTCTSSEEFERELLNLFPSVEVVRLKRHEGVDVRYVRIADNILTHFDVCVLV